MKPLLHYGLVAALLLGMALLPGDGQSQSKVMPKLEPVAETRLLMEALAHANFRGLERKLSPKPADAQEWLFARGQALLLAETANLLMLRPPKTQGEAVWFARSMELRNEAILLAQQLGKKDLEASRAGLQKVANSCNRCHKTFRVPIEIVPFQQAEPPPLRKAE